jgi:hypothetical protein
MVSLAGIYLLRHGPQHERHALTPGPALRALTQHTLWPCDSSASMTRCFGRLADLVSQVPTWELSFARRDDVWDVIAA